jgi:hypothetical protein
VKPGDTVLWWGSRVELVCKVCTLCGNEYWDVVTQDTLTPEILTVAFKVRQSPLCGD